MKMQFLRIFALLCAIPVLMSCSDDEPAAPVPNKPNVLFFHASAGTAGVDVLVDDKVTVPGLAYTQNSGYLALNAGSRNLKVNLAGTSFKAVDTTASFDNEKYYSFFIADTVTRISPLILRDSIPTVAGGKAFIRVVNLAHTQPAIDFVYPQDGSVVPRLGNIGFKKATSFIDVDPKTLTYEIRTAGTTTKLHNFQSAFAANKVYTIVVTGAGANGYEIVVNK
jgi:hypothetical protein